jgi:hypothetical protein
VLEKIDTQGFVRNEFVADLEVAPEVFSNVDSTVDHGAQVEGTGASVVDIPVGSEHLDNIGEFEFLTSCILFVIVYCILQT